MMSINYTQSVIAMMGTPSDTHADPEAWRRLESRLGGALPADYKRIVDGYGPVQVNGHLYLSHPGTVRWNLGDWIFNAISEFERSDFSNAECPGFEDGPVFGGPAGLIPLVDTDRGEYVF